MKKIMVIAASLAALVPASAMAQSADSGTATLTLNGFIPVECTLGLGNETTTTASRTVDLTQGRLTNQAMPSLYFGCNAPYTLSVQSENGGMQNTDAAIDGATGGDFLARYGLNFNGIPTGASGGAAGLDQYELGLTKTTPFVIVNKSWSAVANMVEQTSQLNVEVDTGAGGWQSNGNFLAGNYTDKLTFEISASL